MLDLSEQMIPLESLDWNKVRRLEVATVRSMDVALPVRDPSTHQTHPVRLRVVARPDRPVAELLVRLGLDLPSAPKLVQNVVEKNRG